MSTALVPWVPEEWRAWTNGTGRCPYCEGTSLEDFEALCDCWQYEREQRHLGRSPVESLRTQPEAAPESASESLPGVEEGTE